MGAMASSFQQRASVAWEMRAIFVSFCWMHGFLLDFFGGTIRLHDSFGFFRFVSGLGKNLVILDGLAGANCDAFWFSEGRHNLEFQPPYADDPWQRVFNISSMAHHHN